MIKRLSGLLIAGLVFTSSVNADVVYLPNDGVNIFPVMNTTIEQVSIDKAIWGAENFAFTLNTDYASPNVQVVPSCSSFPDSINGSRLVIDKASNAYYNEMVSLILIAYANDLSVAIGVDGCVTLGNQEWPKVTDVRLVPST